MFNLSDNLINKNKTKKRSILFISLFSTAVFLLAGSVYVRGLIASEEPNGSMIGNNYSLQLGNREATRGYTVEAFDKKIRIGFAPDVLSRESEIKIELLDEDIPSPEGLERVSGIYQFEVMNKQAYPDNKLPIYLHLTYGSSSDRYKQIYFYDKIQAKWRPLPTSDNPTENAARAPIHLTYARVAVFKDQRIMGLGKASWYSHKNGLFAASPDFAIGSRLRVVSIDNGKFVDVTVNDYGPDRSTHPDRVIDLDKVAFAKLTSLQGGTVDVKIEPLQIVSKIGQVAGEQEMAGNPDYNSLKLTAKSAILINESTGEILYDKNSKTVFPLASLTKLVAIWVFLEANNDLDRVVTYDVQDEKYNFQYVEHEWESARLKVADGDTMTVRDLIYSALVGSANNAVESLVRVSGLPRDAFILRMNEVVKGWNAGSTHFVEPTGLSPENVSSCYDYSLIVKNVYKNSLIQKVSTSAEYDFVTIKNKVSKHLRNTNHMLEQDDYEITGTKTGYLNEAGYCLMVRAKSIDGNNLIAVTFGVASKAESLNETAKLLNLGLNK